MSNTPAYDYTETDTDIRTETERAIAIRAWKAGYNARYHEETRGARDETDWTIAERGETDMPYVREDSDEIIANLNKDVMNPAYPDRRAEIARMRGESDS
jgi:hypothetical protein